MLGVMVSLWCVSCVVLVMVFWLSGSVRLFCSRCGWVLVVSCLFYCVFSEVCGVVFGCVNR